MTSSSRDNVWSDGIGLRNNNRNRFVYFNEDLYPSPDLLVTILCVLCHSLFFGQLSCMCLYSLFQACLGEAVSLSEVKKVITEWTDAYEGKYSLNFFLRSVSTDRMGYGLSQQEAEVEVDQKNLPYPCLIHVIFPWYNLRKIIISGL